MNDFKVFFIVGVPRSGTTLLSVFLNNHSNVYLDKDAIAIRTIWLFKRLQGKEIYSLEKEEWLLQEIKKDERLERFYLKKYFDKDKSIKQFVIESLTNIPQNKNIIMIGDKSPDAIDSLGELISLFPNAKIIHVIRDARPNILSLVQRQYMDLQLAAQQWVDWNIKGLVAKEWLGNDSVHSVKYEDLLTKPKDTLKDVCTFLDVQFEPTMIRLEDSAATQHKDAYVQKKIDISKLISWKEKLSEKEIQKIERICGGLMEYLGYQTLNKNIEEKSLSSVEKYWLSVRHQFKLLVVSKRKHMKQRKLVDIKIPLKNRIKALGGKLLGGVFSQKFLALFKPSQKNY
jgi:hypothetical protein